MKRVISSALLKRSLGETIFDLGNGVLYDLCRSHPDHTEDDVIVAKVWLIGRSYAAAIERGRASAKSIPGDRFYKKRVAARIRRSAIDHWFRQVREDRANERLLSLKIHDRVARLFAKVAGRTKRSLASKYLHFHFPHRFYIYDSRAAAAVRCLTGPLLPQGLWSLWPIRFTFSSGFVVRP